MKVWHKYSTDSEKRESFIILFMSFYPKTKSMFWSQNSTPIWLEVMSSVGKVRFQSWSPIPKLHLQLQSKWALCFLPSPPKQEFFLCSVWKLIFLCKRMTWVFLPPPKKKIMHLGVEEMWSEFAIWACFYTLGEAEALG